MQTISRYTKATITEIELPTRQEIRAERLSALKESLLARCNAEPSADAAALAQALLAEQETSAETILAMLLQQQIDAATANIPQFDVPKPIRKGKHRGAQTVKVHINAGRRDHMAPNFILGALVEATGLSGNEFGKIDIYDQYTTVEVPAAEKTWYFPPWKTKNQRQKVHVKLHETTGNGYNGYSRRQGRFSDGNHKQRGHAAGRRSGSSYNHSRNHSRNSGSKQNYSRKNRKG